MRNRGYILICIIIFFAILPINPLASEENLLINSDFEEVNITSDWYAYGNWGGRYVSLSSQNPYSGERCVEITSDGSYYPYIQQLVTNIIPGAEYKVTAYINTNVNVSGFKFEFYSTNQILSSSGVGSFNSDYFGPTNGEWIQVTETFRTPENAMSVSVLPRLFGNGTVCFDNICLVMTAPPQKLLLNTDEVFYYSDSVQNGTASVSINEPYQDVSDGWKVDFSLSDGNVVVKSMQNIDFTLKKAEFKFELSLLNKEKYEYNVSATLKDSNGKILEKQQQFIYKYDRPTYLDNNGTYVINGEIFDPIFAYHIDPKYYPICAEAGINVVQVTMYGTNEQCLEKLELLNKYNLKGLLCLYEGMKPAGHKDNIEDTKRVVNLVKDHPSVFAYAVMDEPFLNLNNPEELLRLSYKTIRDIDEKHPVYMVEAPTRKNFYSAVGKYVDILGVDPYPGGQGNPETFVAEHVKLGIEAVNYKKPVYCIEQVFRYGNYFPTGAHLRHMIYQALLAGAKGIGLYEFDYSLPQTSLNNTSLWNTLKEFNSKDKELAFSLLTRDTYPSINQSEAKENANWRIYQDGDMYYLILQNKSHTSPVNIKITINDFPIITNVINGIKAENVIGSLNFQLEGADVAVCSISSPKLNNIFLGKYIQEQTLKPGNLTIGAYLTDITAGEKINLWGALYKKNGDSVSLEKIYPIAHIMVDSKPFYLERFIEIPNINLDDYFIKVFCFKEMQPKCNFAQIYGAN